MKTRIIEIWTKVTTLMQARGRWVGYGLTGLALVYLGWVLIYSGFKIPSIDWHAYLFASLATVGLYLVSLALQFLVWARLFSFHHKVGWRDMEIYARMILVRRLPGGIWHWLGRTTLYTATTTVPTEAVLFGNLMEWGMLILIAGGISVFGFLAVPIGVKLLLSAVLIGAAVALTIWWQPRTRAGWLRFSEGALWVFLYTITWFIGGIILNMVSQATGANQFDWIKASGVWALSGGVSMIITIAPVIGVQEVSLVFLLQPYLPASSALLVALILRLLFTISDVLWGLVGWGVASFALRRVKKAADALH